LQTPRMMMMSINGSSKYGKIYDICKFLSCFYYDDPSNLLFFSLVFKNYY